MSKSTTRCRYDLSYALNREEGEPEVEFVKALELLNLKSNDKILDVGCNTGEFCYLAKRAYGVVARGIDLNGEAIRIARRRYPDIQFEVRDLHEMTEIGEYDAITMLEVVEHLSRPEQALEKITRALKPNGIIVLTTPNKWSLTTRFVLKIGRRYSDPTHVVIYDPVRLSTLVKTAGMRIERLFTAFHLRMHIPSLFLGGTIYLLAKKK